MPPKISVIIPAYNEEKSIGLVLSGLPFELLHEIIVVDNNSTDGTAHVAKTNGAKVYRAKRQGYGSACLRGMSKLDNPDIVVFLDADYSDYPEEILDLVDPIIADEADFVIGSRMLLRDSRDALLPQALNGNKLAVYLIQKLYGHKFTDLGPFRAIRYRSLMSLGMQDENFGWTV